MDELCGVVAALAEITGEWVSQEIPTNCRKNRHCSLCPKPDMGIGLESPVIIVEGKEEVKVLADIMKSCIEPKDIKNDVSTEISIILYPQVFVFISNADKFQQKR